MSAHELAGAHDAIPKVSQPQKILRFRKSERLVHWSMAIPFLLCFVTALILVFYYNPDPLRPYREEVSLIHRTSGICLIILPFLAAIWCRGDYRIYFSNIKQAWMWTLADIKWLLLAVLSVASRKITLPEQGKFNAAEKVNFMVLVSTYPLYILTGAVIWLSQGALLSWLVHFTMASIAVPLVAGHLYMALINPGSRKGIHGMLSGFVDRQWAKHHYRSWYREEFENNEMVARKIETVCTYPVEDSERPEDNLFMSVADSDTDTDLPKKLLTYLNIKDHGGMNAENNAGTDNQINQNCGHQQMLDV